jgi:hypothetical protein
MKVDIAAPIAISLKDTKSEDKVVLDLGILTVNNTIYETEASHVVLNHISVGLKNSKLKNVYASGEPVELLCFSVGADFYMPIGNQQAITGETKVEKINITFSVKEIAFLVNVANAEEIPTDEGPLFVVLADMT